MNDPALKQLRSELRAEIDRIRVDTRIEIRRAITTAMEDQASRVREKELSEKWEGTFKWALFSMWVATVTILGLLIIALR